MRLLRRTPHDDTDTPRDPPSDAQVNTAVHFSEELDLRPFVSASGAAKADESSASAPAPATPTGNGEGSSQSAGAQGGSDAAGGEEGAEGEAPPRRVSSLLYELYAVLLHSDSLEKGHYFALIRDVDDGCWYRFDVSPNVLPPPSIGAFTAASVPPTPALCLACLRATLIRLYAHRRRRAHSRAP